MAFVDDHALEEPWHELLDDGRQQHELLSALGACRQWYDAWQRARRLHDGKRGLAAEGVLALQAHDEVEALVLDAREGSRRVKGQRREHRLDFLLEEIGKPAAHLLVPRATRHEPDASRRQFGQQHAAETVVLIGDESRGAFVDGRQLLRGAQSVRARRLRRTLLHLLDAGHPDFEEFIEVAR